MRMEKKKKIKKKEKRTRESSEEIYICIIFCCFKRQIKFYLFCASPVLVFFLQLKYEIFILLDWWRMKMARRTVISEETHSWARKKSNLFVRCLYDSINPAPPSSLQQENVICIHSHSHCFSFCFFSALLSLTVNKEQRR